MVYLLKIVIFHGKLLNKQMVILQFLWMKSLSSADKRSEAGAEVKELRVELSHVSKGEPGAVTISERV